MGNKRPLVVGSVPYKITLSELLQAQVWLHAQTMLSCLVSSEFTLRCLNKSERLIASQPMGVGGTIYSPYSMETVENLGLDPQKATKLAAKLHADSGQYADKLDSTRRALAKFAQ